MAIFQISDTEPTVILTGDEKSLVSLIECARLMENHSIQYSILTDELYPALKDIEGNWIENVEDLPFVPNILVDFTWDGTMSYEAEDVCRLHSGVVFLSSSIYSSIETEELIFPAIRFNGLPGFFPNIQKIELAYSSATSTRQITLAQKFFGLLGFSVEKVENRSGFVLPRIIAMIINEASFCVMEKVANPEDIDIAMKMGTNYPKGPLAWADEIGIDIVLEILDSLYEEYSQERYRASILLRQKVREGKIGIKSGIGFYNYH